MWCASVALKPPPRPVGDHEWESMRINSLLNAKFQSCVFCRGVLCVYITHSFENEADFNFLG